MTGFRSATRVALLVALVSVCARSQSVGPDVTVSSLTDVGAYGQANGITAFAVGTVACNVGTTPVQWIQNNNQHPVIAQNMYRFKNGSFQQIGQSWLKHGFASTNSPGCGTCIQPPGGGSQLGVGCTDAYGSGLNGSQNYLGPRSEVNASTGAYPWPHASPTGNATLRGRLLVNNADLDPALNVGARYFVEAHYVTADDAAALNDNNNCTWQEIAPPPVGASGGVGFAGSASTLFPAIYAWQAIDPGVIVTSIDIPGDGRVFVAARGTNVGGGITRYHYVIYNMNSHRSIGGVSIGMSSGANVSNVVFHDVDSHSGEPYTLTNWAFTQLATELRFNTQTFAVNPNANAIRWGTAYDISFESNVVPTGNITLEIFRPGSPATVATTLVPNVGCPVQPQIPPVAFAYTANTSAPYDFVDISATGTQGPVGDDVGLTANLGFTFNFFGTSITQIQISTNGFLSTLGHNATAYANVSIPNNTEPNGMICGYWEDLYPASGANGGGSIKYQTIGTAPNRRFIVHYNGVWHFGGTAASAETFEIILDETTNVISSTCVTTPGTSVGGQGVSATRGVESDNGLSGLQVPGPVLSGTTVRYTPAGLTIPTSALLSTTGNGAPNSDFIISVLSQTAKPLAIGFDLSPGPVSLGALGSLNLGFSAAFLLLADGIGILGPPNPADVTDGCGNYRWSINLGPAGLPPSLTFYLQGIVQSTGAPNGAFHLTNPVTVVIP